MELKNNLVTNFLEKPSGDGGWINGGFFVLNKKIFLNLSLNHHVYEREPLEKLSKKDNYQLTSLMVFGIQWIL